MMKELNALRFEKGLDFGETKFILNSAMTKDIIGDFKKLGFHYFSKIPILGSSSNRYVFIVEKPVCMEELDVVIRACGL